MKLSKHWSFASFILLVITNCSDISEAVSLRRSSRNLHVQLTDDDLILFLFYTFFYKQSISDPRPENCLSFSKKSHQKIV